MKKILLLNAPPGAGKDYAGKHITKRVKGAQIDKFARVLKERTHALYGFAWRPWDYYEDCKDQPNEDFYGLTPRQAYINVSETYFKPVHDDRIFGRILADELDKYEWNLAVITDSGFMSEAEVLIEKYGEENVMHVQVKRNGFDFSGDSRSYLDFDGRICSTELENPGNYCFIDNIDKLLEDLDLCS